MNLKIVILSHFEKEVKKLYKKYKNLPQDLKTVKNILLNNPKSGIRLGHSCYKIRVANSSVPTGKSGGFRVIYYYLDTQDNIYLLSIYSKNELENISENVLLQILKENQLC
ncbi:MAG: hypothetical protein GXO12_00735 [Epsilonproteobacteria bacterium]|nr:hypothetical protein [Campylobacterota bacterium]